VETSPEDPDLWLLLARHYEARDLDRNALQAWVARALVSAATFDDVSFAANKLNGWIARQRIELDAEDRRSLGEPLIEVFERRSDEARAGDFSRLAWLYMNVGRRQDALRAAERGLELDANQYDCRRFVERYQRSEKQSKTPRPR
jgi:hypothetical protein